MKIGCLQFASQVGDIENNLNRADAVLSKADPQDLDLLVLPELAFTGYNFRSLQDISPFLEPSGSGITSLWARTIALKYNCNVSVGYPEKVDVSGKWPTGPEYYNSNIVVNADGETIANYRKSFLYNTDQKWALEGPGGFYDGWIPGLGNTAIGICMDINPYKFEAPWDAFEFAYHILESESKVVIVSMAWITREESRSFSRMPQEPDMDTLTYWVTRLEPLIRSESDEEIIVVFCNRTGSEDEAIYAGTSTVIGIYQGEVKVYGLLGRGTKELLVVDTTSAPIARLVYRPDAVTSNATGDRPPKDYVVSASLDTPPLTSKADIGNGQARVSNGSFDTAITDKDSDFLAAAEHNNAISSINSQRRNTLPPVPPPAPILPDEDSLKAYKTPIIAPLQVHTRLARMYDPDSARSPSSPIPSAVSSSTAPSNITGMCPRPKLVIPQSPTTQRPRYSEGEPYSASSEISHHSLQSIKSDQSEASVQTVTSNPRPPEDSTPYPHSGIPLSGYPANSLQPRKIYGGGVDISRLDSFSPTTPFDDMSPIASDWQWRNPGSTLQNPVSGGGWMTGTPVGRRPEPFQWPVIQAMPVLNYSRKKDDKQASDKMNHDGVVKDPNLSTEKIGAHPRASRLVTSTEKKAVERPSSPKSRNASRSRNHTRSNSAANQHEATPAVANNLESISRRARSRSCSKTNTPGIERQSMSRASNRTSMQGPDNSVQPHGLRASRVTPSPNLFDRNRPGPSVIPTPAALDYYRNVPETQNQRSQSGTCIESSFAFMAPTANARRSVVRIPSRGRRPEPREPVATPQNTSKNTARSSSADSTRNDVLHRRESSRTHGPNGEQHSPKTSRVRGQRRPSNGPDMRNFERVEAVLRPNCPVHGRRSESARNARDSRSSSEGQNRRRRRSDSVGNMPLLLPATTYDPPLEDLSASRSITQSDSSLKTATNTMANTSVPITPKAPRQANFPLEIQQMAENSAYLPDRPGTAPSSFYPATPKAMVFDMRDVNSAPTSAKADALSFAPSHSERGKSCLV